MNDSVQRLIGGWVEGDLDEAGRDRLAAALAVDPHLASTAAEQARYAALLRLAFSDRPATSTADSVERLIRARRPSHRLRLADAVEIRVQRRRRSRLLRWSGYAAAALVLLATILLWPASPAPTLTVVSGQARLAAAPAVGEGARIRADAGDIVVGTEPLVLQTTTGGMLRLAAGSHAGLLGSEPDGRQRLQLLSGQLGWSAEHHPGRGGLRLTTVHGSVLTEGTVFDCRLIADAAVVRLAEGQVRVASGTGSAVVLQPGQATVARTGFPPATPLPLPPGLVWTAGDPADAAADRVLPLPWHYVPGLVPARTVGRWHSLPDGTQACTAVATTADGWASQPRPDHEVMIGAARDGSAMVRLEHGCVVRFRVRAERTGRINLTMSVPPLEPGLASIWASSEFVPVEAGVWRDVELPVAIFWSRVKADWESAAISSLGCWGYGAGAFVVSALEIRVK